MQIHNSAKVTSGRKVSGQSRRLVETMLLGFMLFSSVCHAATFNWPTPPNWSNPGPTSGNTEIVDYGYNAQGSLRATVFNSGMMYNTIYPTVQTSAAFPGANGGFGGQNNLILYADSAAATTSYTQVTITFQYTGGANNVSFSLYDVDFGGNTTWIDKITNITGTAVGGGTVNPTSVTGSSSNSVTGNSGIGWTVTGSAGSGNDSPNGNVIFTFAPAQAITSFTFRWSNDATTTRTTQWIGLSPINFTGLGTAFPEVNSSSAALMLCGGVMGFGLVRRRRSAERLQCHLHA